MALRRAEERQLGEGAFEEPAFEGSAFEGSGVRASQGLEQPRQLLQQPAAGGGVEEVPPRLQAQLHLCRAGVLGAPQHVQGDLELHRLRHRRPGSQSQLAGL